MTVFDSRDQLPDELNRERVSGGFTGDFEHAGVDLNSETALVNDLQASPEAESSTHMRSESYGPENIRTYEWDALLPGIDDYPKWASEFSENVLPESDALAPAITRETSSPLSEMHRSSDSQELTLEQYVLFPEEPSLGFLDGHFERQQGLDLRIPTGAGIEGERTLREALNEFDPTTLGLEFVEPAEALEYIRGNSLGRPWIAGTERLPWQVACTLVSLDKIHNGHLLSRHGPYATESVLDKRLRYQRAPEWPGKSGKQYKTGYNACSFTTEFALIAAVVRVSEHPRTSQIMSLETIGRGGMRRAIFTIDELLGPQGHRYCRGSELVRINGENPIEAMENRDAFAAAYARDGLPPDVEPLTRWTPTFKGGLIGVRFKPQLEASGWQLYNVFPKPPHETTKRKQ